MRYSLFCLCVLLFCFIIHGQVPSLIKIGGLFPLTGRLAGGGVEREAASRIAVENINNDLELLPNTQIEMITLDTGTSQAVGLTAFLDGIDQGIIVAVGAASSSVSSIIAIAGGVFDIPQLSYSSTSAILSDVDDYPLFGRMVPPDNQQGAAFAQFVDLFGWGDLVSAISTADDYGVGGVDQFIQQGDEIGVRVLTYQQFLAGETDIEVEMNELEISEARVFLAFLLGADAQIVLEEAQNRNLIGESYVWLCSDGCAQTSTYTDSDGDIDDSLRDASRGLIGLTPSGGKGEAFELFLDDWETRDPTEYPGAGDRTINLFAPHAYDCLYTFANAFDEMSKTSITFNSTNIIETIRNLNFIGLTGDVRFEENGDRIAVYDLVNLRDNDETFTVIGSWSANELENGDNGFIFDESIQFFDGTENVPDLFIETPFDYWDCKERKEFSDPTGKEIDLTTPDTDPDFISDHYICDQYIDCDNMSDENFSCSPSYAATFVSFGILTSMLILTIPFFCMSVCAFGFIWKKRRIRLLSPVFLLGMCVAAFMGYCSTFAWYGKPHVAACNFQPWLLGLSVNLMIAFLFAKTFRIWRIFKSPFIRKKITDWQLLILVGIIMIPCVLILIAWTAFSTPTATIVHVNGEDHYVCETGGLTGPPGGYVFFGILVGYTSIVLLFGVFLAFVTRNVPSEYSESKLVGYSVYNLMFLAAVGIPVFFVLRNVSPVAGWIIRTIAILYGFTATLWLQFIPPLLMLAVHDKCAAVPPMKQDALAGTGTASASVG